MIDNAPTSMSGVDPMLLSGKTLGLADLKVSLDILTPVRSKKTAPREAKLIHLPTCSQTQLRENESRALDWSTRLWTNL
jgi:hypothetical protein